MISGAGSAQKACFRPLSASSRLARRALFSTLHGLACGRLEIRDADGVHAFGRRTPQFSLEARLRVTDPAAYGRMLLGGSVAAGEAYAEGLWDAEDPGAAGLTAVCRIFVANRDALNALDGGAAGFLRRAAEGLVHRFRDNTVSGARRNIRAHYDLGNDFFRTFLDQTLMYSSAIFPRPDADLEEASREKNDRICRKLRLSPRDHVLEIGTGWGGFAIHAASQYGCRVTTTTISRAQHDLAKERVCDAGVADKVTLLLEDYRALTGVYDKLVSIEMIEAVGLDRLGGYFRTVSERLAPDGAAAIQAILIRDQYFEQAKKSVDFIQKHIFPGSGIPSTASILAAVRDDSDLRLTHMEDFASHYARTLRVWHDALLRNRGEVSAADYPERLVRLWRFYFSYCEAGFSERQIGVAQFLFAKPDNRMEPVLGGL
jgi:cyclopropane-fatty-acyl-phospholipid synthase